MSNNVKICYPVPQTGTRSLLRRFNLALTANKKIATVGAVICYFDAGHNW